MEVGPIKFTRYCIIGFSHLVTFSQTLVRSNSLVQSQIETAPTQVIPECNHMVHYPTTIHSIDDNPPIRTIRCNPSPGSFLFAGRYETTLMVPQHAYSPGFDCNRCVRAWCCCFWRFSTCLTRPMMSWWLRTKSSWWSSAFCSVSTTYARCR